MTAQGKNCAVTGGSAQLELLVLGGIAILGLDKGAVDEAAISHISADITARQGAGPPRSRRRRIRALAEQVERLQNVETPLSAA